MSDDVQARSVLLQIQGDYYEMKRMLATIELHTTWRWQTKQLTTEQRELWASIVEEASAELRAGTREEPQKADRWWLCPTCGISIQAKAITGPHEHCMYADDPDAASAPADPECRCGHPRSAHQAEGIHGCLSWSRQVENDRCYCRAFNFPGL